MCVKICKMSHLTHISNVEGSTFASDLTDFSPLSPMVSLQIIECEKQFECYTRQCETRLTYISYEAVFLPGFHQVQFTKSTSFLGPQSNLWSQIWDSLASNLISSSLTPDILRHNINMICKKQGTCSKLVEVCADNPHELKRVPAQMNARNNKVKLFKKM